MLYRVIKILAAISIINKRASGEISFGECHYAPSINIEHVFLDPKPLNLQIAHLDTLIKFHIPSQSYFSSTSKSTSKLYDTLHSIKNDAIMLKKLIDKAWNLESSRICTIINVQESITQLFENIRNINERKKRDIDFDNDESFKELFIEYENEYNEMKNNQNINLEAELLRDLLQKIDDYKMNKDRVLLAGIRKIICDAVNNKRTNLLKQLLFGLIKDTDLLNKRALIEMPNYTANNFKMNILAIIRGNDNIEGFDINNCDENTSNEINISKEEQDMDKTIEEMKEDKFNEDKFSLEQQKLGIICSTPNIKGSCDLIGSVLKKNLIMRNYKDTNFIESLNVQTLTYNDLMNNLETEYETKYDDLHSKELIYGEPTILNLDILNSVIYKHAETKKDVLIKHLIPLEKTIKYVHKQMKNVFNAKNELIDETYYKNCATLKNEKEIAVVNKKLFSFKEKSNNNIILKIMPFCYNKKCFKIKLPSLITFGDNTCTYIAHSDNKKFAFCNNKATELPSCAHAKKQSLDCIFETNRPMAQYNLVKNVIYVCDRKFEKCEYFKYARVLHNQYISNGDIEIFDNEQNVFDISFVEEYESEIINATITFIIIITSAIIIKCFTTYIPKCCTKSFFKKVCCYLCISKKRENIELNTIRKTRATLNPYLP